MEPGKENRVVLVNVTEGLLVCEFFGTLGSFSKYLPRFNVNAENFWSLDWVGRRENASMPSLNWSVFFCLILYTSILSLSVHSVQFALCWFDFVFCCPLLSLDILNHIFCVIFLPTACHGRQVKRLHPLFAASYMNKTGYKTWLSYFC